MKKLIDLPCDSMGLKQAGDLHSSVKMEAHTAVSRNAPGTSDNAVGSADAIASVKEGGKAVVNAISGDYFQNTEGKPILLAMVKAIQANKDYLAEVDGLIGDGDHGMNMNKGFTIFEKRFGGKDFSFTQGLDKLGDILFSEIGGSMGPIYGTVLKEMADAGKDLEGIDLAGFYSMLDSGLKGLQQIVQAQVGDKTLVDTLSPAVDALKDGINGGVSFKEALGAMKQSAAEGRDSTKDLVAKFGRSSRLGERSRGVLDAGATSCCIILTAMADAIIDLL